MIVIIRALHALVNLSMIYYLLLWIVVLSRQDTSTVELKIGGPASAPVSIESLQELLSCGARRLKLLPGLGGRARGRYPWSAAAVRAALLALRALPGADHLEIEVLPAGGQTTATTNIQNTHTQSNNKHSHDYNHTTTTTTTNNDNNNLIILL